MPQFLAKSLVPSTDHLAQRHRSSIVILLNLCSDYVFFGYYLANSPCLGHRQYTFPSHGLFVPRCGTIHEYAKSGVQSLGCFKFVVGGPRPGSVDHLWLTF